MCDELLIVIELFMKFLLLCLAEALRTITGTTPSDTLLDIGSNKVAIHKVNPLKANATKQTWGDRFLRGIPYYMLFLFGVYQLLHLILWTFGELWGMYRRFSKTGEIVKHGHYKNSLSGHHHDHEREHSESSSEDKPHSEGYTSQDVVNKLMDSGNVMNKNAKRISLQQNNDYYVD